MKRTTQACAVLAVLLTASAALGQTSTVTTDYTAAGNTYIVRVAAHTLEAGTVVYQKTDGKAAKANYYYQDRSVVIGICTAKALQHQPAIIQTAGEIHIDRNAQWPQFSTLVPGHVYGLYDSGGFLRDIHTLATTSNPPHFLSVVGVCVSPHRLKIAIANTGILIAPPPPPPPGSSSG